MVPQELSKSFRDVPGGETARDNPTYLLSIESVDMVTSETWCETQGFRCSVLPVSLLLVLDGCVLLETLLRDLQHVSPENPELGLELVVGTQILLDANPSFRTSQLFDFVNSGQISISSSVK